MFTLNHRMWTKKSSEESINFSWKSVFVDKFFLISSKHKYAQSLLQILSYQGKLNFKETIFLLILGTKSPTEAETAVLPDRGGSRGRLG